MMKQDIRACMQGLLLREGGQAVTPFAGEGDGQNLKRGDGAAELGKGGCRRAEVCGEVVGTVVQVDAEACHDRFHHGLVAGTGGRQTGLDEHAAELASVDEDVVRGLDHGRGGAAAEVRQRGQDRFGPEGGQPGHFGRRQVEREVEGAHVEAGPHLGKPWVALLAAAGGLAGGDHHQAVGGAPLPRHGPPGLRIRRIDGLQAMQSCFRHAVVLAPPIKGATEDVVKDEWTAHPKKRRGGRGSGLTRGGGKGRVRGFSGAGDGPDVLSHGQARAKTRGVAAGMRLQVCPMV